MKKPAGYDTAEAFTGDFKTVAPGGHVCKIVQAKVDTTTTGKEVLILLFDIVEGESKAFYKEQYDRNHAINPEAKWQGVYRQLTEGESSLKFFKGMITAIEESNPGYKWNWDEKTLANKLFGGVFGQEEFLNGNNEVKLSTKCMFIRNVEQVRKGVEAPKIKRLKNNNATPATGVHDMGSFGSVVFPEEEIPF